MKILLILLLFLTPSCLNRDFNEINDIPKIGNEQSYTIFDRKRLGYHFNHQKGHNSINIKVPKDVGMEVDFGKFSFYSKQYNHPIDKIEVEYFIVKRKLWENAQFPQKRVQKFSPASGTVSMNKVAKRLNTFLDLAFDNDGNKVSENILIPSRWPKN